jgi:hypothetical protein
VVVVFVDVEVLVVVEVSDVVVVVIVVLVEVSVILVSVVVGVDVDPVVVDVVSVIVVVVGVLVTVFVLVSVVKVVFVVVSVPVALTVTVLLVDDENVVVVDDVGDISSVTLGCETAMVPVVTESISGIALISSCMSVSKLVEDFRLFATVLSAPIGGLTEISATTDPCVNLTSILSAVRP